MSRDSRRGLDVALLVDDDVDGHRPRGAHTLRDGRVLGGRLLHRLAVEHAARDELLNLVGLGRRLRRWLDLQAIEQTLPSDSACGLVLVGPDVDEVKQTLTHDYRVDLGPARLAFELAVHAEADGVTLADGH